MSPKVFFDGVNEVEGYKKSTVFAAINIVVTFLISAIVAQFSKNALPLPAVLIGAVVAVPIMIVFLFIGAAILHIVAKILGGKAKLVGTYQSVAYSSAIGPATALPYIGLLFSLYQIYLVVVGLRKMHQFSTTKAVVTVLLPLFILMLIAFILVVVAGVAIFSYFKSTGINPTDLKNLENIQSPEDLEKLYPTFVPDSSYPTGYEDYQDSDYSPSL